MRRRPPLLVALVALSLAVAGCAEDAQPPADPPPPPNPMIVSFDDGGGQIFVMDADGSGVRQITRTTDPQAPDDNYAGSAALSPDGSHLAYTRGGRFIDVVDLESGDSTTVHEGGYDPEFSPDGSTIAFSDGTGISLMKADGSDVRTLVSEEQASAATFSPDGSRVLYMTAGYIMEVPATGGEPTLVLRDQFYNADPVISPDGSTMVFASNRGGRNGSEIYAMPVGGGEITPLTDTYAVHPTFTPDGSTIVYTRVRNAAGDVAPDVSDQVRSELASMNSDGTNQKTLTPRSITAQIPSVGGGQ
ncbi:hypothetical protein GCM10007304_33140 [Rhodococcoides trifolii]|uniref:TolB protein n=1 Tax=Rhodococcoides trifolii TaxID=908250 RepID=A0A917LEA1_9NOCA|nr:PD40 domain-containing protein [Rhodococcus trifolii]GGG16398.1 hypothetical protein GCM10007304_33140 [Rhodococcus trifolii]